jgi:dipeptidyl-peptidase-4
VGRLSSIILAVCLAGVGTGQSPVVNQANWKLADKFSATATRPYVYSSRVTPIFLKDSDSFWYVWREASGKRFMYVDPSKKLKEPLFDQVKLAAQPFDTVTMTEPSKFFISVETKWYVFDRAKELLEKSEKGPDVPKPEVRDYKNMAADKKAYVYALEHNLYVTESTDEKAFQISFDGEKDFSFGGGGFFATDFTNDGAAPAPTKVRPGATWSEDSKQFFISRFDSRLVKELFLVNNLNDPRPALVRYRYAMPGEEHVPQQELWVFSRTTHQFKKLKVNRYKDQLLLNVHFDGNSDHLRFVRRDRLQRNLELCDYDLNSDQVKVLFTENIENAFLEVQPVKYIKPGGDFLWFSERTGWGQYYLYSHDGKLKGSVTTGPWRAESIVDVDANKGLVWVNGVGREKGENPYYTHTYRMKLDGSDFRLINPGDADHSTTLSHTKKFIIDSFSRVDLASSNTVFDESGTRVVDLERQDLSRLEAMGWKMPETFHVKSEDGVVDIYGNMWKPFDFDPKKKYPIILNVYPGPQTESVAYTFNPVSSTQSLAQLGFIVIQIGNRGGSPQRSKAYHSYGYYNLRDYGLADKKSGVEQLAAKYPWIDIERVGIFGHSGGGFMTAAALLLPPYNEFFKVGVSSSGNHDNNIYNSNWSEQHHGLTVSTNLFDTGTSTAGAKKTPEGDWISPDNQWVDEVTSDPLDAMLIEDAQQRGNGGQGRGNGQGTTTTTQKTDEKKIDSNTVDQSKIKFEIKVPTTVELAPNLIGKLLITTGDMDNNVHPANSIRLVNALIKANKRFDFMIMPGQPHGYGPLQPYFQQMLMEYFAEHLMGDYYRKSAEMKNKGN